MFSDPKVIRELLVGGLEGLSGGLLARLALWVLVNFCLCLSGEKVSLPTIFLEFTVRFTLLWTILIHRVTVTVLLFVSPFWCACTKDDFLYFRVFL